MFYRDMPIEQRKILSKIRKLKEHLNATDYQAIKYAEGEMSASDYAPVKAQRIAWRAEINVLEAQLKSL